MTAAQSVPEIARALDQAFDAVLMTDAELESPGPRIVYVNAAFERLTGYARDELLGRSPRLFQGPRTDRAMLRELRQALGQGKPFHAETVNYRKDGSSYWVEWDISPVRDEHGRLRAFLSIQRDVTRRKEAEIMLGNTMQALRRSNERLREFGAVIAHDLQQPLGAARGFLDLLLHHKSADLGPAAQWGENARTALDRMADKIRALVEAAQEISSEQDVVSLDDVVATALKDLQEAADSVAAVVEVTPLPAVLGNAAELREVFQNLIGNAIKYRAEDRRLRIRVRAQRVTAGVLVVEVIDNGRGIPPDRLDRVFDHGVRAHSDVVGTGLGLSFVRRAMERANGAVALESVVGEGTIVSLSFPLAAPLAARETGAA